MLYYKFSANFSSTTVKYIIEMYFEISLNNPRFDGLDIK